VDIKALRGTSPDAIQALADSSAFLSRAVTQLVERAHQPVSSGVETSLAEELLAWRAALQEALGKLADDPTAGRAEGARQRLARMTTRLEAQIRDALDAGERRSRDPEDEERLYLLLAAYRSVSEALVDYVEKAASIDWTPWREERFA